MANLSTSSDSLTRVSSRRSPARVRADNRRGAVLDAAAHLFSARGYHATSMRDIAAAVQMGPGSLYYHFPSKDALLLAAYEEGVGRIADAVDRAIETARREAAAPWQVFEAACAAHAEMLLDQGGDYARLVVRIRPEDCAEISARLVGLRDAYEARFTRLIAALELPDGHGPASLRRLVLGALNWAQTWYRPGGESPGRIAGNFLRLLASGPEGRRP